MFYNHTTFIGGLVNKGELKQSSNGNSFLQITLAKNYSIRDEANNDWIQLEPTFVRSTLWGKEAELFANSNIPNGTPLLVNGHFIGERSKPYVNRQGVQVPAEDREMLIIDAIGPLIGRGRIVSVSSSNNASTPTPQASYSAPAPAPAASQAFVETPSNDLFGPSAPAATPSGTELFDDLFQ